MPAKTILSPGQRAGIFDPSGDREILERLYTLGPDDLAQVCRRRRGANRRQRARSTSSPRHCPGCVEPWLDCGKPAMLQSAATS